MNGEQIRLSILETDSVYPFHNQSLEEYLFETVSEDEIILYLWQNRRTVVIGKNQNAYRECDIRKLEEDHGFLARRTSGGGAVYHDLGNLNFTFLSHEKHYDLQKQNEVILKALNGLGIEASLSGRNDLLTEGRKFSGHAYRHQNGKAYHHGTLMVDVNREDLERYLQVSPLKYQDRSVSSVRSRVVDLKEIRPDLTIGILKEKLFRAFEEVYRKDAAFLSEKDTDEQRIQALEERFKDPSWRYGKDRKHSRHLEKRFPWGTVSVGYDLKDGKIIDPEIHSDALDTELIERIREKIADTDLETLLKETLTQEERDILEMFREEDTCTM